MSKLDEIPLCVDLDGTLILTDMLHESSLGLVRQDPVGLFSIPGWLAGGKARLKRELARRVRLDPAALPYNVPMLEWLRLQRANGRKLVLCTASDTAYAEGVAAHLGLFDETLASDGERNLAGRNKAAVLCARFGERGFDYAGNSSADLEVWSRARRAVVVNASPAVSKAAAARCEVEHELPAARATLKTWFKALRIHQWMKNGLLFVPMLAAHQIDNLAGWFALLLAFLAFGLTASAVYVTNDLLDLESDRLHPRKRKRAFAVGLIPVWQGAIVVPLCLCAGVALGSMVSPAFLAWLGVYFAVTTAYSVSLKRVVLLDCLTLAGLYTLRVVAGAAAIGQALSFWLLAASVFLFLSLAFVKRYAELLVQVAHGKTEAHGRGYVTADLAVLQGFGICAGFASVLVLALYLNSEMVSRLYASPQWVWGTVAVLLFWVCWIWLKTHRGEMHDDPMVFAVKDRTSLVAGFFFVLFLVLGAF